MGLKGGAHGVAFECKNESREKQETAGNIQYNLVCHEPHF